MSMTRSRGNHALWLVATILAIVATTPVAAQFGNKPTRPQVKPPDGAVRKVIFKNCTSCHGIDDYAYNALDRGAWNALLETKHTNFPSMIADADRAVLLDWLAVRFGPTTKAVSAHLRPARSRPI
jgi:hypothetical protein